MATEIHQGTDLSQLDYILTERFAVGEPVDLLLTLPRTLTLAEVASVQSYMENSGLDVRSAAMTSPDVLKLSFARPARPVGYALLPLSVLIIAALGVVFIGSILGWQVGTGLKSLLDSIGKMIVPLAVIGGFVFLIKVASERKRATKG